MSRGKPFSLAVAELRSRTGKTELVWVKGHANDQGNEEADKLAGEGARCPPNTSPAYLPVPSSISTTGIRLEKATQSLLHRRILHESNKEVGCRSRARENLDRAQEAVQESTEKRPSDRQIWTALKKRRDYPPNIQTFLWKCIQGAHKCGPYWLKIKNYEERGMCHHCDTTESMEHILFQCPHNGSEEIWKVAQEICALKDIRWPRNFYTGHLYASSLLDHKDENGKRRAGAKRLFTIVVSECAYVIWKIRNERVIAHGDDELPPAKSSKEARGKAEAAINLRLNADRLATNTYKLGRKALPRQMVLRTWSGTLANQASLPDDWIGISGVLVGKPDNHPKGRNR
ncbi:hypothetical protein DL93DRAFT_2127212 [Clavulina sp. PMI_390]|nr:hypothetical protein DL93DRAFT_2127212 [Clavulina sp. PMI_390]